MKSPKEVRIAALCLFSVLAIAVGFTLRTSSVHAAKHATSTKQSALAQPAAYLSGSLGVAFASDAMLLNSVVAQRVTENLNANPMLPDVEEFTLMPPNPAQRISKTTLSVRFPEREAEKLPSQIPMTLARQNVVLQRSVEDSSVFSTRVDFNWAAFVKMQQHRQELASQGRTVPIYKGRDFIGRETVQFVDPADIERALQTHQPIQFTSQMLIGGDLITVVPDHELTIINDTVVEDSENGSGRTYDPCLSNIGKNPGNPNGAWTFQTLWMAAINTTDVHKAQLALQSFLANWQNPQPINGFTVATRPGIGSLGGTSGLLTNWPIDDSHGMCNGLHCPSLQAPVRLNAIVNRIDLAEQPGQTPAGELRFVFGVTAGNQSGDTCSTQGPPIGGPPPFNIIFEYHVPSGYSASTWAGLWNGLPTDMNFGSNYVPDLQSTITDKVVKSNSCIVSVFPNTCLFHIRTNEVLLTGTPAIWELREFVVNDVNGGPNTISEITVDQTPDGSFNFGAGPCHRGGATHNGEPDCSPDSTATVVYLNANGQMIVGSNGTLPLIPLQIPYGSGNIPFRGGSSLNAFDSSGMLSATYWNVCAPNDLNCNVRLIQNPPAQPGFEARRLFSENTCNGCHGDETKTSNFQQVFNREAGQQSNLSNFLLGCVPTSGSCASGNAGPDDCTVGTSSQCALNSPGQESVLDPANHGNGNHSYGDIVARQINMSGLASPGNEFFLPFMRQHIGVH